MLMLQIFSKPLKLISLIRYSYSATIYYLKNYLDQHGSNELRYSVSENFAMSVYIFQAGEKYEDLRKAHFFMRKFKKSTKPLSFISQTIG